MQVEQSSAIIIHYMQNLEGQVSEAGADVYLNLMV
jgi:hypothetical protein